MCGIWGWVVSYLNSLVYAYQQIFPDREFDEVEDAIEQILGEVQTLRSAKDSPWQPIETAPRDGRHVLVYGLLSGLHRNDWVKACYRADYAGGKPYWQWGAPGFTGVVAADYWMPVPDPPPSDLAALDAEVRR